MKAVLLEEFGGPENMSFGEVNTPVAGDNQILVKVMATSVNRPDLVQREGNYRPPPGDSDILGLEVAGEVAAVGEHCDRWKPGDRVMALIGGGGYAEYALAHQDHAMAIPENMSFNEAACICETYLTAFLNLFILGGLSGSQTVLIHGGGGGVATAAIQLCRYLVPQGPRIVTCSTTKVDRVRQQGADHVIDYRTESFVERVADITGKKGANVILDHIGAAYLSDNMKSLSVYGRLVIIGVMSGVTAELNLALMMVKRQRIIGSVLRARPVAEKSDIIRQFHQSVGAALAERQIVPEISAVFPLSEASEAHRLMEQGGHFGKIVLEVPS